MFYGAYRNQDVVVQGWTLQPTSGPHTRNPLRTRPRAVHVYTQGVELYPNVPRAFGVVHGDGSAVTRYQVLLV